MHAKYTFDLKLLPFLFFAIQPMQAQGDIENPVYCANPELVTIIRNSTKKNNSSSNYERKMKSLKTFNSQISNIVSDYRTNNADIVNREKNMNRIVRGVSTVAGATGKATGWGLLFDWAGKEISKEIVSDYYLKEFDFNNKHFEAVANTAIKYQIKSASDKKFNKKESLAIMKNFITNNSNIDKEVYDKIASRQVDQFFVEHLNKVESNIDEVQAQANQNSENLVTLERNVKSYMKDGFRDLKGHIDKRANKLTKAYKNLASNQLKAAKELESLKKSKSISDQYLYELLPVDKKIQALQKGHLGTEKMSDKKEELAKLMTQKAVNDLTQFNQDLNAYSNATITLVTGIGLLDEEDAAVINDFVNHASQAIGIATNIMSGNPLGYMNAANGVMSMLGGGSGDPATAQFAAIMEELKLIRKDLDEIKKQIEKLTQLTVDMYNEMRASFNKIYKEIIENRKEIIRINAQGNSKLYQEIAGVCNSVINKEHFIKLLEEPTLKNYYNLLEQTEYKACFAAIDKRISGYQAAKENPMNIASEFPPFFKYKRQFAFKSEIGQSQFREAFLEDSIYKPAAKYLNTHRLAIIPDSNILSTLYTTNTFLNESEILSSINTTDILMKNMLDKMLIPENLLDARLTLLLGKFINSRFINAYILKAFMKESSFDEKKILNDLAIDKTLIETQTKDAKNFLSGYQNILDICIAQNNLMTGVQLLDHMYSKIVYEHSDSAREEIKKIVKNNKVIRTNLSNKLLHEIYESNKKVFEANYKEFVKDSIVNKDSFISIQKLVETNLNNTNWGFNFKMAENDSTRCIGMNLRIEKDSFFIGFPSLESILGGQFVHRKETLDLLEKRQEITELIDDLSITLKLAENLGKGDDESQELKESLDEVLYSSELVKTEN